MTIHQLGLALAAALALACGSDEAPASSGAPATGSEAQTPAATPQASHDMHDLEGMGEHAHDMGPAGASAPSDLASAFAALDADRNAIAGDVEAGTLAAIHEKAERLGPLAVEVGKLSGDLGPDERARVESAVKQVYEVADRLHEAADGGNDPRTRAELTRLDAVLQLLRAQFPASALESGPAGAMHDDGAMSAMPGHQHTARPLALVDAPAQATVVVKATEFAFEPRALQVRAGVPTRIELDNRAAKIEHSLIVHAPSGGDLIHLHAGPHATDAGTYRLDTPGTYDIECTIPGHTEAGMIGKLVVSAAAPGA